MAQEAAVRQRAAEPASGVCLVKQWLVFAVAKEIYLRRADDKEIFVAGAAERLFHSIGDDGTTIVWEGDKREPSAGERPRVTGRPRARFFMLRRAPFCKCDARSPHSPRRFA